MGVDEPGDRSGEEVEDAIVIVSDPSLRGANAIPYIREVSTGALAANGGNCSGSDAIAVLHCCEVRGASANGGNFGASGAIAVLRCCETRGAFAASGERAWNSGGKVVPAIRRKVSCVRSPLTLEDGGDARVAVSGSLADDETGACFPFGFVTISTSQVFLGPRKDTAPPILP